MRDKMPRQRRSAPSPKQIHQGLAERQVICLSLSPARLQEKNKPSDNREKITLIRFINVKDQLAGNKGKPEKRTVGTDVPPKQFNQLRFSQTSVKLS